MNVKDMVVAYLKEHGYDGLFNDAGECACKLDDPMPCGDGFAECEAGYLNACTPETCALDGDCAWHIGSKKEEK